MRVNNTKFIIGHVKFYSFKMCLEMLQQGGRYERSQRDNQCKSGVVQYNVSRHLHRCLNFPAVVPEELLPKEEAHLDEQFWAPTYMLTLNDTARKITGMSSSSLGIVIFQVLGRRRLVLVSYRQFQIQRSCFMLEKRYLTIHLL